MRLKSRAKGCANAATVLPIKAGPMNLGEAKRNNESRVQGSGVQNEWLATLLIEVPRLPISLQHLGESLLENLSLPCHRATRQQVPVYLAPAVPRFVSGAAPLVLGWRAAVLGEVGGVRGRRRRWLRRWGR